MIITIEGMNMDDSVRFNHNQAGFFITKYEDSKESGKLLSHNKSYGMYDRFGILFDLSHL
jgi:hypothetical protein